MNLRYLLWRLDPSLGCLNSDRKKRKNSTFDRNLNVTLTPSSIFLQVKTAILCVLSLNSENRGVQQVEQMI